MNRDRILGWIRRDIMEGHLRPMKERLYIAAVFGVIGLGSCLWSNRIGVYSLLPNWKYNSTFLKGVNMKKTIGILCMVLGLILAILGLFFVVYYGLNWELFYTRTGVYQVPVYLIYIAILVAGCGLVWFSRHLRRKA